MKAAAKKSPTTQATGKKPAAKKAVKKGPRRNPLAPERIAALLERLAQAYPGAECALHHSNAWELMVATILSAQCTDARVNMVTPALFKKFPTPTDFAHAPLVEIEEQIRSTGFYHNKAKSLNGAARKLTTEFGGKVPQTMDELLTLPGVARKTANVVLGVAFGKAVDDQRRALGLSVAELAGRADMTLDEIDCIEEGGTEPAIALLRRLAATLDADVRLTPGHDLGSVWVEPHAA